MTIPPSLPHQLARRRAVRFARPIAEAEERVGAAVPETGAVARPDGAYRTPQPDRPNGGSRAHDPRDSDRSERKPPQVQDHRGRRRLSCARYVTRRIRNPDLPAHIRSAPGLAFSAEIGRAHV